ncbi:MAG: type II toxin-antitoxin system death-on-curing family toxin [Solirubrobacterales bacterium]
MTLFLTSAQALLIAEIATGTPPEVRDMGLLESAILRPRTTVTGADAYPELEAKAAALLQSLARNHPLVDGNKRLAWLATWVFLAKNGTELDPPDDDEAYGLVIAVANGELEKIDEIADRLRAFAR